MHRREHPAEHPELGLPMERSVVRVPIDRELPAPVVPNADAPASPGRVSEPQRRIDAPTRRPALDDVFARIERGDTIGAIARLDDLLSDAPDDVELLCTRGTLHAQHSRFDRATADLHRAARIAEHDERVLIATGMLACRRARWGDAVAPLREAAALTPDDSSVQYYLGEAYNHVDELMPALTAYERAAELDPSNWRALKGVGIVLDRLGRRDEATEAHRRAWAARTP